MSDIPILVSGDVKGRFKAIFGRTEFVNSKKGPFKLLLCVGDFFAEENIEWGAVTSGEIKVPIPTYILGPSKPQNAKYYPKTTLMNIAPNITYLGKWGVFFTEHGLKIAFLSGIEGNVPGVNIFTWKDVANLIEASAKLSTCAVDILLTYQYPHKIGCLTTTPKSSVMVTKLVEKLAPVYHFCGLEDKYIENVIPSELKCTSSSTESSGDSSTRFIGLASVGNAGNKWLYGFHLKPNTRKFEVQPKQETADQQSSDVRIGQKREGKNENSFNKKGKTAEGDKPCWFCFTSPQYEKQLLIRIFRHSYLALAKGPLTKNHYLIIPIDHIQSFLELSAPIADEIELLKKSLVNYFDSKGCNALFFERNYASFHLNLQVIPLPKSKQNFKSLLFNFGNTQNVTFDELSKGISLNDVIPKGKSYFYIEIMGNNINQRFVHVINRQFPMQFGRMFLASKSMLDIPDQINWRGVNMDSREEEAICQSVRSEFLAYDLVM